MYASLGVGWWCLGSSLAQLSLPRMHSLIVGQLAVLGATLINSLLPTLPTVCFAGSCVHLSTERNTSHMLIALGWACLLVCLDGSISSWQWEEDGLGPSRVATGGREMRSELIPEAECN